MWIDIHNALDTRIVGGRTGGWEPGSNGGGRRRGGGRGDIKKGRELGEMGKISQHWNNILQ